MRFILTVLQLHSFFAWQTRAVHRAKVLENSDDNPNSAHSIRSQEIVASGIKADSENLPSESQMSFAPFSQSLATYTINFDAQCEGLGFQDDEGTTWEYSFNKAKCDLSTGDNRRVKITCNARYHRRRGRTAWHRGRIRAIYYECPENTVCRRLSWLNAPGEPRREEIACVDDTEVTTDQVTPANSHAYPNVPDVYCGLSLAIPGTQFTVNPGIRAIDIILTEEARFPDGSPYPAPMIYIRDKTSGRGFDRVFRRDASVATAQVTLTAVKGKFHTRTFDFCMQLLPGLTTSAVTFTYSWFQTTNRHGRIPEQLLLTHEKYSDTALE